MKVVNSVNRTSPEGSDSLFSKHEASKYTNR